jgi:hypothetical protein
MRKQQILRFAQDDTLKEELFSNLKKGCGISGPSCPKATVCKLIDCLTDRAGIQLAGSG